MIDQEIYQNGIVVFKLIEEIGQEGCNSQVFKAHDALMNAKLVVKKIQNHNTNTEKLLNESRCLYASTHPNVAQIQYACVDDDFLYIAMPYYEKGSLSQLMDRKNLTAREIIKYSINFLSGILNIHSKKLIHADIKPNNILIANNNEAIITDFGLTSHLDEAGYTDLDSHYILHTPPEFVKRVIDLPDGGQELETNPANIQFDIFQIGLTIYRMCLGNYAFKQQFESIVDYKDFHQKIKQGRIPDREAFPLHTPDKIIKIIQKCLKVDLDKRYKSVLEILNALSNINDTDCILDWEFECTDEYQLWHYKDQDGRIFTLKSLPDGSSHATKQVNSGPKNISQMCKLNTTKQEIKDFLKNPHLK